jgi:hypothetical protein
MNDKPDLFAWAFNRDRSEAAKLGGMARAEDGADDDWWACTLACVREIARRQEFFTSDDVERLRIEIGGPETPEKRAYGPLIMKAKSLGFCEIASPERFERSVLVQAHRRPMRVWRSLLYGRPNVEG